MVRNTRTQKGGGLIIENENRTSNIDLIVIDVIPTNQWTDLNNDNYSVEKYVCENILFCNPVFCSVMNAAEKL